MLNDRIIVYAYVCGDIIHRGHLLALKNAKILGEILIVGVLTDEAIMECKSKPTISFYERLETVSALKYVDIVVPQKEYSPHDNVAMIKPDILMESQSHSKELLDQSGDLMKKIGGRMIVMPYFFEQSSTRIKDKIKRDH